MGLFGKLFGGKSGPAEFWTWFVANKARFEGPPQDTPQQELAKRLKHVDKGLVFVVGHRQDRSGYELEISADGMRELIPTVREVVDAAPAIEGWTIHAFRQAHPGLSIEMGSRKLDAETVFFIAQPAQRGCDVVVFIEGYDDAPDAMAEIGFILLDSTVGELAVMTKIEGLEFADAARRPPTARPLSQLGPVLATAAPAH